MHNPLTAIDLFAGCGGSSEGARLAGVTVKLALNHWPVAVATHALNHPFIEHCTQDLQQADFTGFPDSDVLMASPACQGHSDARGGVEKPHHDPAGEGDAQKVCDRLWKKKLTAGRWPPPKAFKDVGEMLPAEVVCWMEDRQRDQELLDEILGDR